MFVNYTDTLASVVGDAILSVQPVHALKASLLFFTQMTRTRTLDSICLLKIFYNYYRAFPERLALSIQ